MRLALGALALLAACAAPGGPGADSEAPFCATHLPPNVVVIFADDLGWGDLSCYGETRWRTPHLDRLADEGTRFTRFYVSQPVCSASRASLLTGCYANRLSIAGALGPGSRRGLNPEETTLGELLQGQGYATALFGKWHLGHHPESLPTRHGFDEWYGLPYSNDMWRFHPESPGAWAPLPLMLGDAVLDLDPDQTTLTRSVTERAVEFVEREAGAGRPFFLCLAHPMPHVPIFASLGFAGRGPTAYADTVRELDWSVGEVLAALDRAGVTDDTLVLFTSDNGPWLSYGDHAGGTGGLREGKGTTFEGGVRVPALLRYPRGVPAGRVVADPLMTIDVLPSIAELVEAPLPGLPIDGRSALDLWLGAEGAGSPQELYGLWYHAGDLEAVVSGRWKLHFPHSYRSLGARAGGLGGIPAQYDYGVEQPLALYDLEADPGESVDRSAAHPEVVARLRAGADALRARLGDRLTGVEGREVRPLGPPR
ncbi:MAG: sulfatase [Planctomycetota bacterium]|nr:sulfatase [Planctomycetota bacterium]